MKKNLILICFFLVISFSTNAQANWFKDIIDTINKQGGITNNWLSSINAQQGALLDSQRDVEKVMKQMNGHFTSHSGWGTYQFRDYQSYGGNANSWASVMKMAESGQGSGALGHAMGEISHQFPIDTITYKKGISDSSSQKYYAIKTQTILAARAASQLDYNKIQEQIAYQQMLQQQIEKTKDLKAAIDLSNRIQVEGNLINLEILRQTTLLNQQQAVSEQANVNNALANARFLTK